MQSHTRVAVIGGGVVGCSVLYHLTKLGWTDVAFFSEHGVSAVNLGPGDPAVAHMADEHLERSTLEVGYEALRTLLAEGV